MDSNRNAGVMGLVEMSTRRRVTIAMITVSLVLFGLIGLSRLKINLLPDLSYPTLTVRTEYVGAAPAEIESLITEPVEEAVGTVKGVRRLRSVSRTGQSDVVLEFSWGTTMDAAAAEVREKLELLQLPLDVKKPLLLRFNPATEPILRLSLTQSQGRLDEQALKALRRFGDDEIQKRLEPVSGVAAVKIAGGLEDEVQVLIDQNRLQQVGIDINSVIERLRSENVNLSGGRLDEGNQRFLVRTLNQFRSVEEIGALLISVKDGVPIRLRDVAEVKQGFKEREAIIRVDGMESVEIAVYKEGDANTVSVVDDVLKVNKRLENLLPPASKLSVIDDQSRFIRSSIGEVKEAAFLGGLLSILIIYLFLANPWSTFVIALSLPVSIVATFFFMQQFGISLNVMSLGGIALATGMVVDNAIVVLENTERMRAQGYGVIEAAVRGTSEVGMAITASTLTHVAVFIPLVFVEGISGQLFRDQAITVSVSLLISLFVALTLIPMLASLKAPKPGEFLVPEELSKPQVKQRSKLSLVFGAPFRALGWALRQLIWAASWILSRLGRVLKFVLDLLAKPVMAGYAWVEAGYGRLLPFALRNPLLVIGIAIGSGLIAARMAPQLGMELLPEFAQAQLKVEIKLPPGTPLAKTDQVVEQFTLAAGQLKSVAQIKAESGSGARLDANPTESGENIGRLLVDLAPGSTRADEPQIIADLRQLADRIPGAETKFSRPELFSFAAPIEVELAGIDLEQLRLASLKVSERMRGDARFADVKNSLEQGAPEIRIIFDQERTAALGLTTRQVADQLVRKVRGEVATRYNFRERKIDVLVRAEESDRASIEDIRKLVINPNSPQPVPLSSVATIEVREGPAEIRRSDQERVALITANLAQGDLGSALQSLREQLRNEPLAVGVTARVAGQSDELQSSLNSLLMALALAVFLVYLVMASQFESLKHPFLILFSVPLALVGAIYALYLTASTVNVVVFIGLIMLVGIVVSNAIVLIDRVNQKRDEGSSVEEALIAAGTTRLRPIIMTTLTTLFGFLPMALGLGEGAEVRRPLAITVIGGLTFSTLLTLVVVPVLYELVENRLGLGRRSTAATADTQQLRSAP
jgi:HAE1 family hydrophobic/amphiphilic exporter-1